MAQKLERWEPSGKVAGVSPCKVAAAFTPQRVVVNFPDGLLLAHGADKQNPTLLECFGGAGQAVILEVKCMQGFTESFIMTAIPLPKSLLWSFGTCPWS